MRVWTVCYLLVFAAMAIPAWCYAAGQPVLVGIDATPRNSQILIDGAYTGLTTVPVVQVRFPSPGTYNLKFVHEGYLPLTVKLQVPLSDGRQNVTFVLNQVNPWEWLNWNAMGLLGAAIALPLALALIMLLWKINFANALGFGTLGSIVGLLVGLSNTPVVGTTVQALLTFIGALAAYWFGVKVPNMVSLQVVTEAKAGDLRNQIGAYMVSFAFALLIGLHLGGYSRELSEFSRTMRATYWGLQTAPVTQAISPSAPSSGNVPAPQHPGTQLLPPGGPISTPTSLPPGGTPGGTFHY